VTRPVLTSPRDVIAAWAAWGIFYLVMAGIVLSGSQRTVTPVYWQATVNWFTGHPLYTQTGHGFIYLPQAGIVFAPFAALPPLAADVLWRLLTVTAYAVGVRRLANLGGRDAGAELFPLMTCLCIPLAWDSARNGQATLLATALMIFAVVDLADRRWGRVALWLLLGLAVKPMLAFLLLLAGLLYRPMRIRLLAGIALLAAVPFLLQRPDYVLDQYREWARMLVIGAKLGADQSWAQIFGMLSTAGIEVAAPFQTGIRATAALLTVALCLLARQRNTPAQAAVFLFVLHGCFLMLFSPRTENNTYSALAPAIAVLCAQAWLVTFRPRTGMGLATLAAGILGSYEIGRRLVPGSPPNWLAPLMCVCFTAYAVVRLLHGENNPAAQGADAVSSSREFA